MKKQLLECIPNFSEGRDQETIARIALPFREVDGVRLLNIQSNPDHNRTVITAVGAPQALVEAMLRAAGETVVRIDMQRHRGQHPRMGAVDVVPFVPFHNITLAEAAAFSIHFAEDFARRFQIPVFLYEASASQPARENLAVIRKGEYEGMAEKLLRPEWKPDFGPETIHATAGVTAVGARKPLVAFNVNLATNQLTIAKKIASAVRHEGGGLRHCKAIGIALEKEGITQVSMNLTDFSRTAIYRALELIRLEARRYGVAVIGSEIVGLVPMAALIESAAYYLQLENFSMEQILESYWFA